MKLNIPIVSQQQKPGERQITNDCGPACLSALTGMPLEKIYQVASLKPGDMMHMSQMLDTGPLIAGSWTAEISGMISLYFDEDELRTLCLLLNIDYQSLGGDGKRAKAERLVGYLDRRGRSEELLEKLDGLRPKVAWPSV